MEPYVIDSSALIELHNHFRSKIKKLKHLVQEGYIKLPEGVFRELRRKTDMLYKTVEQWKQKRPDCIVLIGRVHDLAKEFVRIEQQYGERILVGAREYPGFWKSPSGRKAADSQVVAVAKILDCTVVSHDREVQLVCMLEGVVCIGWAEFARQVSLSRSQMKLF